MAGTRGLAGFRSHGLILVELLGLVVLVSPSSWETRVEDVKNQGNHGKTAENHRKTIGKPLENHRKMEVDPLWYTFTRLWNMSIGGTTHDFYGHIQLFITGEYVEYTQSVNLLNMLNLS